MAEIVYAVGSCWVSESVFVTEGDAWYANDPVVRAHPDLFRDRPAVVRSSPGRVEQATAAPGEQRNAAAAVDDLDVLRARAEFLGVKVDRRWGAEKLQEAIEAAGG